MQLALRLGRSLQELLATVSSDELTLWQAFDRIEPIGDWRSDLGFGLVCATIANYAGKSRAAGAEPAAPQEFMPLLRRDLASEQKALAAKLRAALMQVGKKGPGG